MNIKLTSVFVDDPIGRAFTFYTDVLGFAEKMLVPEAYLAIVVSADDPDGTALMLEPNNNPIAKTYQEALYREGLPCIVFGVADVQAEYDRLTARGVVFSQPPTTSEWGTIAVLDDTCGNFIQLHQD